MTSSEQIRPLAGGLSAALRRLPPLLVLADHRHTLAQVALILSGELEVVSAQGVRRLSAGAVRLVAPGAVADLRAGTEGVTCLVLAVDEGPFTAHPVWRSVPSDVDVAFAPADASWRELRLGLETAQDGQPWAAAQIVLGLLSVARSVVAPRPLPQWFGRVLEALHRSLPAVPRGKELARIAGVHRGHLARVFRNEVGLPLAAYARALRLDHACLELVTGSRTVSHIAAAAGFSDHAHFTRTVRRSYGVPPSRLRSGR